MYTLLYTLARTRGRTGRWAQVDLADMDVFKLWTDYSRLILVLSSPLYEEPLSLDLNEVRSRITKVMPGTTLNQWLAGLGNESLPTSTVVPKINPKYVTYRDAIAAGYSLAPVPPGVAYGNDYLISDAHDLRLWRDDVTPKDFYDNCLVEVNGLLHRVDYDSEANYIPEGGRTGRICNDNHVGILNFSAVGGVRTIPITPEMIAAGGSDPSLLINTIITVDEDLSDKTVMLSFMGFLLPWGRALKRIGEKSFSVDLRNQVFVDWYFHVQKRINLESIRPLMTIKNGNYDQIALEEFFSNDVITKLFTLSQTFLVVINNNDIYVDREQLEVSKTPDRYFTKTRPLWPVVIDKGELMSYWVVREGDTYVLAGSSNRRPEYNFETTHWTEGVSIDPTQDRHYPNRYSKAYFLKIGSDL